MEQSKSKYGLNSLLQALAILRDNEDFHSKFGTVSDTMNTRRETTVTFLCDILIGMKREIDAKNRCTELLQQVSEGFNLLQRDTNLKDTRITDLEKERDMLLEKVRHLEEVLQRNEEVGEEKKKRHEDGQRLESDSSDGIALTENSSTTVKGLSTSFRNIQSSSQNTAKSLVLISTDDSSDETKNFESSRFDIRSNCVHFNEHEDGCSTQQQVEASRSNETFTALTSNPYEQLNSIYYNPTQFYERQSSTFKRASRGRGARGRGSRGSRKKTPSQQTTPKQRNGKSQAQRKKKKASDGGREGGETSKSGNDVEVVAATTVNQKETTTGELDQSVGGWEMMHEVSPNDMSGPREESEEEDPNYFDWTTSFLEAVESSPEHTF